MSLILIKCIAIKGVAALLEMLVQYLITRQLGVSGYGNFAFYVNIIDISFWILFSGMVKSNTYYLSDTAVSIHRFKRSYFARYVLPLFAAAMTFVAFSRNLALAFVPVIVILYLLMMDASSTLLARGEYTDSLLGEYLVGRGALAAFLVLFIRTKQTGIPLLLGLYGLQYVVILLWFWMRRKSVWPRRRCEEPVSLKKLWQYQQSDIATGLIGQTPVILQYLFIGAYEAGFVGIVTLVKKVVGFVTGPTSKVFLPQFSKLHKQNRPDQICLLFKQIMQLQMLFLSAAAVVLLGFSELVLSVFSPALLEFAGLFRAVSASFLFVASLGPGTGLLQMTGNEKTENRLRWFTIAVMISVCLVMRESRLFALYGMCAQGVAEGIIKYGYVCRLFGKSPMPVFQYVMLWVPAAAISAMVLWTRQGSSLSAMLLASMGTVMLTAWILFLFCDKETREKALRQIRLLQRTRGKV